MTEATERELVIATIRKSLEVEDFRLWRIATYGREVFLEWGDVYRIEDDGSLVLTHRAA